MISIYMNIICYPKLVKYHDIRLLPQTIESQSHAPDRGILLKIFHTIDGASDSYLFTTNLI